MLLEEAALRSKNEVCRLLTGASHMKPRSGIDFPLINTAPPVAGELPCEDPHHVLVEMQGADKYVVALCDENTDEKHDLRGVQLETIAFNLASKFMAQLTNDSDPEHQ